MLGPFDPVSVVVLMTRLRSFAESRETVEAWKKRDWLERCRTIFIKQEVARRQFPRRSFAAAKRPEKESAELACVAVASNSTD